MSAALCAGALLFWLLPAPLWDWQPELAWRQPWRAWTAALVHWSPLHLAANLLAAAVVGAYGHAARVPRCAVWAWLLAWPMTQIGLLLRPELAHYGGLSGMLHGGVAIVCAWLLMQSGRQRAVGAAVTLGLLIKLGSERPWGPALQPSAEWDIAIAPLAHATGAAAGLISWALCWLGVALLSPAAPSARNRSLDL